MATSKAAKGKARAMRKKTPAAKPAPRKKTAAVRKPAPRKKATAIRKKPAKRAPVRRVSGAKPATAAPAAKPTPARPVARPAAAKPTPTPPARPAAAKPMPTPPAPAAKPMPTPPAPAATPTPTPPAQLAPPGERIGVVTHYYSHLSVAIVRIDSGTLRVGDVIHIRGYTTDFSQRIESMELNHAPVTEAGLNDEFGMKVAAHAREHDVVYKVRP